MRDKLIELLKKKYDHYCDQCGVNKQSHYIENLADYLIANGVTVQQWIPVSERLPETEGDYLTISDFGDYAINYFNPEREIWGFEWRRNAVTHWMPMPEEVQE